MSVHETCQGCGIPIVGCQRLELRQGEPPLVYAVDGACCRNCAEDVALRAMNSLQAQERFPTGTRVRWELVRWPQWQPIADGTFVVRVLS